MRVAQNATNSGILRRVSDHLRLAPHPFTPRCDEHGVPTTKIAPYGAVVEPCAVCPGHCCHLRVKVSLLDAIALCRAIDVPLLAALVVRTVKPHEHSFRVERDPRVVESADGWTGHAELELRHDAASGRCHYLLDIGGYRRCAVYAARPTGCRTYPVGWTTDTQRGGPGAVACPVPYAIRPDDERRFLADVQLAIDRWAAHKAIVEAWNARDAHALDDFFAYAIPETGTRVQEDVSKLLVEADADARLLAHQVASGVVPGAR